MESSEESHSQPMLRSKIEEEQHVSRLKERFNRVVEAQNVSFDEEDDWDTTSKGVDSDRLDPSAQTDKKTKTSKWKVLQRVMSVKSRFNLFTTQHKSHKGQNAELIGEESNPVREEEVLLDFWKDDRIPPPPVAKSMPPPVLPSKVEEFTFYDNFLEESKEVGLSISTIPEEVLIRQREVMEADLFAEQVKTTQHIKREKADVVWREHLARERLKQLEEESYERLKNEKNEFAEEVMIRERELSDRFIRAKAALEKDLKLQRGKVKEQLGELASEHLPYSRQYVAVSQEIPQPIEVHIRQLRAVKTKLPKGAYAVMLTAYNRLGGSPLSWKNTEFLRSLPCCTSPASHQGRYFDRSLTFEESVYAVLPPKNELRPSFCLIFELYELKSKFSPIVRPIAWAVLPMCNEHFSFVRGKFRLPFLKGEHSPSTKLYSQIETSMASDMNSWLCNMYIDIKLCPLPKNLIEPKNSIGFNFIKKYVSIKESSKNSENLKDEDERVNLNSKIKPFSDDLDTTLFSRKIIRTKSSDLDMAKSGLRVRLKPRDSGKEGDIEDDRKGLADESSLWQKDALIVSEDKDIVEKGYNSEDEFFLLPEQSGLLTGIETISSKEAQQWVSMGLEERIVRKSKFSGSRYDKYMIKSDSQHNDTSVKSDNEFEKLKALGKSFSKSQFSSRGDSLASKHEGEGVDYWQSSKSRSFHRGDSQLSKLEVDAIDHTHNTWLPLEDEAQFAEYQIGIVSDPANRVQLLPAAIAAVKARYLISEIFIDVIGGTTRIFTFDFNVSLVIFLIALWICMFIHYMAEYLVLSAIKVPIFGFAIEAYQVYFKYNSAAISFSSEILTVAIGPLACLAVFMILFLTSFLCMKFSTVPEQISVFVAYFGFCAVFDPIIIFFLNVVSLNINCSARSSACASDYTSTACHCFIADATKLYEHLLTKEGNGGIGILVTFIIYLATLSVSSVIFYEYLVHVHQNGRLLDLWRRINAPTEEFFIPNDFEVSQEELGFICHSIRQWRGLDGSTRHLQVSHYIEKDPYDPAFEEHVFHYAIYTLAPDGKKTMYRQFLHLDNGAVIEIFDQFVGNMAQKNRVLEKILFKNQVDTGKVVNIKSSLSSSKKKNVRPAFVDVLDTLSGLKSSHREQFY